MDTLISGAIDRAKGIQRSYEFMRDNAEETDSGGRALFVGIRSNTASESLYAEALKMEADGKSKEDILKETGWLKGADGKWRFEINDKDLQFNSHGFFSNPDVQRYKALELKFINGEITESEATELKQLQKSLEGVKKNPKTLGDYVKHDALFEAYPFLRDLALSFSDSMAFGNRGSFNGEEITLNSKLLKDEARLKRTLIHEIQHAIQDYEGFAGGSNPDYFTKNIALTENEIRNAEEAAGNLKSAEDRLLEYKDENGDDVYLELAEEYEKLSNLLYGDEQIDDEAIERRLEEIEQAFAEVGADDLLFEYLSSKQTLERIKNRRKNKFGSFEMYHNTAGEEEARDSANRIDMTDEERRETFPESAKENPDRVFAGADENVLSLSVDNSILDEYNISKLNDYVHVQKQVLEKLKSNGFFSDKGGKSLTVVNDESGMVVEIAPKGIKETFGKGNRFETLPREIKLAKLSTIYDIPNIIKVGRLSEADVKNYHNENSSLRYAYIVGDAEINDESAIIKITVRQSPQKNKFWMHQIDIDTKENIESKPTGANSERASAKMGLTTFDIDDSLSQSEGDVKPKFSFDSSVEETKDQIYTDNFKEWFGDWQNDPENASKVVNEDGTPKVVYHGTDNSFTVFDISLAGQNSYNFYGDGFYFSDKKKGARNYGDNIIPAYLDIKNPYYATEKDAGRINPKKLIEQKYDGIIIKSPSGENFVVFNPTQIKSATDNIGTFDKSNPDIRFSFDDMDDDELFEMFTDDVPVQDEVIKRAKENFNIDKANKLVSNIIIHKKRLRQLPQPFLNT